MLSAQFVALYKPCKPKPKPIIIIIIRVTRTWTEWVFLGTYVCPRNYIHGSRFAVVCDGLVPADLTYIIQDYFIVNAAISELH